MKYIECPKCKTYNPPNVLICNKCGYDRSKSQKYKSIKTSGGLFCISCNQWVMPKLFISNKIFLMLVATLGIGVVYLPFIKKSCPFCKDRNFTNSPADIGKNTMNQY